MPKTKQERIDALKDNNNRETLVEMADSLGLSTDGTKAELAARIVEAQGEEGEKGEQPPEGAGQPPTPPEQPQPPAETPQPANNAAQVSRNRDRHPLQTKLDERGQPIYDNEPKGPLK